jgi:hypothetical protein
MRQRSEKLYLCGRTHPSSRPSFPPPSILHALPCTLRSLDVSSALPSLPSVLISPRLRLSSLTHEDATRDVEACIHYLTELENVWVGARRNRLIIEELLKQSRISTSIWDMSGIGTDEMGEYMLGETMGIDLQGFDFG